MRTDTRAMRSFTKAAYQGGVVIVKCGNDACGSRHLIADHLGWFGAKGRTVEDMMQDQGQGASRVPLAGTLGLVTDDALLLAESGTCRQHQDRAAHMDSEGCAPCRNNWSSQQHGTARSAWRLVILLPIAPCRGEMARQWRHPGAVGSRRCSLGKGVAVHVCLLKRMLQFRCLQLLQPHMQML